eukprot:8349136-Prorocentrum_lima.AAC.1
MTSSLVGSEMCIRDRGSTAHGQAVPKHLAPGEHGGQHQKTPSVGSNIPVSYTHLTLPTICSV